MTGQELMNKVHELGLPLGHYVVFGSGLLAVFNLRAVNDIDIFVTEAIFEALNQSGLYKSCSDRRGVRLVRDAVEVWSAWGPGEWDIEELIKQAVIIDGIPFVGLQTVLQWKKQRIELTDNFKDKEDVPMIESYLAQLAANK
jgi:hypothetical protein